MADSSVDLLALNRQILLEPQKAGSSELVALLELEKPGLQFLCPLARVIYWIETDRQERIDASECLGSLWLIDESEARGTGGYGEEYADVNEIVSHAIITTFGGREIDLGFESSTSMVHYQEFWADYLRSVSGVAIDPGTSADHCSVINQWFNALDEETKRARKSPNGYPTDSGEFIGTCTYTLTTINGLAVNGPTFSDTYHEQDWAELNEDYPQRWDGDEENSSFCWLHYLSREQAEQIGIADKGRQALGDGSDYPAWVPKKLAADLDDQWIHADQVGESYRSGVLIVAPSAKCVVAVGCGAEWNPSDPESQVDPEVGGWDDYPANASPLLRIEISRCDQALPTELARLLPYIERLNLLHS